MYLDRRSDFQLFDPSKQLGGDGVLPGDPLWWEDYNKRTANVWPDNFQRDVIVESYIRPTEYVRRHPLINPQHDEMKCLGCEKPTTSDSGMCLKCYFNPPGRDVDPEALRAANVRLWEQYGMSQEEWMDLL